MKIKKSNFCYRAGGRHRSIRNKSYVKRRVPMLKIETREIDQLGDEDFPFRLDLIDDRASSPRGWRCRSCSCIPRDRSLVKVVHFSPPLKVDRDGTTRIHDPGKRKRRRENSGFQNFGITVTKVAVSACTCWKSLDCAREHGPTRRCWLTGLA